MQTFYNISCMGGQATEAAPGAGLPPKGGDNCWEEAVPAFSKASVE